MIKLNLLGFWEGADIDKWFLARWFLELSQNESRPITVIGPFKMSRYQSFSLKLRALVGNKADFYVTGENQEPRFDIAKKQIGFWKSYKNRSDVLRFPNWMWHLDWPGVPDQPAYSRYGMRLSIDRLLSSIDETYRVVEKTTQRKNRAVIFTSHLREPRSRLYKITDEIIGCDGYGLPFGTESRQAAKMPILEQYKFCLCPENSIGDGYVTEKIPEAFHAGCIPITWCRPEDLKEDFNAEAVVNLYGLDEQQIREVLAELAGGGEYYKSLISIPLLTKRPSLQPVIDFIGNEQSS